MKRIIIIHWNKSTGPETLIQYPPEKDSFPKDLFLKIWTIHELNKEDKMIQYTKDDIENRFISVIQKFEGEIYFLVLVYAKNDEKTDDIINSDPDLLANISKDLIQLINTNKISNAIFEAYSNISVQSFTKLQKEELFLNFFKDKIKHTILNIMRNGVISKKELKKVLENQYGFSTINLDLILITFIRENLISKKKIAGSQECYFLVRDLSIIRVPPSNNSTYFEAIDLDNINEMEYAYKDRIIEFFENYSPVQQDNLDTILSYMLDKNFILILKALRKGPLPIAEALNHLNNNEAVLNELIDANFVFEARGYVFLLTDVKFITFLPIYIIKRLTKRYQEEKITLNEFLTHLHLLLEHFLTSSYLNYQII
ncbi:MAG: hypothetical protein BAJALOKI1v1_1310006 [Promethearchaeota archaeon]|nr:MAG: hypothetical protein BAJALOKI1v1_1310006 [Candidatus Lokiarchaeota archaeon]